MRNRMERLVILPFSVGCISEASVAVGIQPRRSPRPNTNSSATRSKEEEEDTVSLSSEGMKNSLRFLVIPKSNISTGFHRLLKGFKNISQFFADKEDLEELEMDMEIGCPTDVEHVTHIGWDGSTTANPVRGWDNLMTPELLSLSSVPFKQYELSMAPKAGETPLIREQGVSLTVCQNP
ncbi:CRIB domain containing protein [Quillaja saponaria]|uniref:CRIB domain containing protein n=1 Tax=Quillaja saponaria TaxID=32244 RepID=A0AAD7VJJ5_QUISA|nr:CRIB domain containing protein [Quillaja saponaria]